MGRLESDNDYNECMESLKSFIDKSKKSSFVDLLLFFMRQKELDNPTVYKRALMDRKLFSKLVSDRGYKPSKKMVCRLALALHLDAKDSKIFIKRAGFILTSGSNFDLTMRYCIENYIYDIYQVEALLEKEHLTFFD
jgi:O-acetyl-ADP-ribose deacetylase